MELTQEQQAISQEAYRLLDHYLNVPRDTPMNVMPTIEQKRTMILLTAIRFHWTHSPDDLLMLTIALMAYRTQHPNEPLPRGSSVEFFIGPDTEGN